MNLAAPGTEYGPCRGECTHPRCKRARKAAGTHCRRCELVIGYDTNYVADPVGSSVLVHATCRAAEIGAAAPGPARIHDMLALQKLSDEIGGAA